MTDTIHMADRPAGVPALERALTVLECLAQSRRGYSVSELSRRLALPKSSVHLILRTLERRGYLQKQMAGGRYRFGMKLVSLGRQALDGVELRDEARPALSALARNTGLTVHMGILERNEIVIIERLEAPSAIRVVSWVGRRMNLKSTAVGKALIAYLPAAEFDAQLRATDLPRSNERGTAALPQLKRELERVHQLGYATCDEEDEAGVRSVGAPNPQRARLPGGHDRCVRDDGAGAPGTAPRAGRGREGRRGRHRRPRAPPVRPGLTPAGGTTPFRLHGPSRFVPTPSGGRLH